MEKRERESINVFPILLSLLGRMPMGRGEGDGILKDVNWKEYQVLGNFIHPCNLSLKIRPTLLEGAQLGGTWLEIY